MGSPAGGNRCEIVQAARGGGGIELDIFQAARVGDCARLANLLRHGADLNARDRWDCIPLYYACLAGHEDAVRLLLRAGTIFDVSTLEGERCNRAVLNVGIRSILREYELPRLPAVLRSAFVACPANRAGAEYAPTSDQLRPPAPPDITLYVQGRPIEAHRVILAARSPYFRTKLATEWRNRKAVTFSGSHSLSFELMYSLIGFFYSDRLEVPAEDIEDLARICKACKCNGIVQMLNKLIARQKRQLNLCPPLRPFVLQGRSMDHVADRLPSALRQILHDCLANSRVEDLHDDKELVETCARSSAYDDLADVCVKVGDRVFRCHQLMLTLGSEYFKTRLSRRTDFLHDNVNGGGELPLLEEHDVSAEAFEKMLEYIYTDELEHLGDDPLFMAEELLEVASRYLMFRLKQVVAALLLPHLDLHRVPPAEVCRWLMLSDMYEVAKVREHCLEIIARNFEAFAEATEFRALLLTLQPDAQDDFVSDLRERWLAAAAARRHRYRRNKSAAARLDRRNKGVALFEQRLEMLLLATEAARCK